MCKKVIYVTRPKNDRLDNFYCYRRSYEIVPPKVLKIKNITATYNGICFTPAGIIKESVQAYPDKIKIFELESYLQFKSKPTKYYGGKVPYLMIHHPWVNYYHWLTEAIPRIWSVKGILGEIILLLPDHYKDLKFIQESLSPFDIKKIEYIPSGYNVKIRDAIIPQIKPFCGNYDPSILTEIQSLYIEYAKKLNMKLPILRDRIYIIRGNSQRRRIMNEGELMKILDYYGFSSIRSDSYSFFEQVIFSNKAKFLISNGSGLTNMHFMKEGSTVLELQKRITNMNDFHDKVLWYLASALNHNYYYFICDPQNKDHDMYTANLKINLRRFERRIVNILNN